MEITILFYWPWVNPKLIYREPCRKIYIQKHIFEKHVFKVKKVLTWGLPSSSRLFSTRQIWIPGSEPAPSQWTSASEAAWRRRRRIRMTTRTTTTTTTWGMSLEVHHVWESKIPERARLCHIPNFWVFQRQTHLYVLTFVAERCSAVPMCARLESSMGVSMVAAIQGFFEFSFSEKLEMCAIICFYDIWMMLTGMMNAVTPFCVMDLAIGNMPR